MAFDDDGDTTVTAFIDCDGNYIRPPRLHFMHAMDSARNADLVGIDRTPLDRFRARSERTGRLPATGRTLRIFGYSNRAGDALALRAIHVLYDVVPADARQRATDTTARTDCDGNTITVPEVWCSTAADSSLNSSLSPQHSDQDRKYVRFRVSDGTATALHRVRLEALRAGAALGLRSLVIDYDIIGERRSKARSV